LKVALNIQQILMLKNKIYKYFFNEIIKNFITILLTFTAIAWVVKAVNFLDLMVEDGYNSAVYFKYSVLNITTIVTRFVPLSFLLSLTIAIIKFERQQELLILWTAGLAKIKIVNIFLLIGFFITLFQLVLSFYVNPFLLNKSRSLLTESKTLEVSSVVKSDTFSDGFEGITFFIDSKNTNGELINVFIKDVGGNLNTLVQESGQNKNSTITAEKGFINNGKLVLFNGVVQTLNQKNEIKNILFEETELSLKNIATRTIKQPKIQETSSASLLKCIFSKNINLIFNNCSVNNKANAIETVTRRLGTPLYVPLISIITSFLLINKKEKTYNFLKKYILFFMSFIILIFSEILLKYTGLSLLLTISYFAAPITATFFFYIFLSKKIMSE
jgi:lipopolysaccharide export system permease protein